MSECNSVDSTYYQRNRGVILNRAKDYYENDKERLREQATDKTETWLKKTKTKKENIQKTDIINMSEEKTQRLKKYQKNYREAKKSHYNNE